MAIGYDTLETVHSTDTFEEWRKKTNAIITFNGLVQTNIGDLNLLSTEDKFSIVNAIIVIIDTYVTSSLRIDTKAQPKLPNGHG